MARFQDLRGECILARVIGSGTIRKSLSEINLCPRIFLDGLLRRVLSERLSKGGGVLQEIGELTSLDRSLNT